MHTFNHRAGRHLEIHGARIYVETLGDPANPPLVMLHGGVGSIEDFNPLTPKLAQRFHLVGIDSRGQGASSLGSRGLSYALLQADVEAVAAQLQLDRYHLMGFSDGGIVGLRMAASPQSGIGKLVAIGAHAAPAPGDKAFDIYRKVTAQGWREKFPEMVQAYEAVSPDKDFDALVPAVMKMWMDDGPDGYPGDSVARIRCELLLVRGDDDHLVSRASTDALLALVPHARYLSIPFAGHEAHKDQTAIVAASADAFWDAPARRAG